jgi:peptide/nickel transport system substrate-binding protein
MSIEPSLERLSRDELTRRQMLRGMGAGGLALSMPAVLAACGGSSSKPKAARSSGAVEQVDNFTWLAPTVQSLDIARDPNAAAYIVACIATEPLVAMSGRGVVGHLAEKWTATDPTTYVYTLRPGVKYWDGSPVTVEDAIYSIERHLDPKVGSLYAGLFTAVKSVKATGDGEITVKLKRPDAGWAYAPTNAFVAPRALVEKLGKDWGAPGKEIMGSGPFKVTEFHGGDRCQYVANDAYWGRKPFTKNLTVVCSIADLQAPLLAMQAGEADGSFAVSPAVLSQWKAIPDVNVITKPSYNVEFASFDTSVEPWDDVHVRRAFAHALDRPGLFKALFGSSGELQDAMIPRAIWSGVAKEKLDEIYGSLPRYEFNLDKARQELAQSRYPNGLTATIWYYSADTNEKIALTWARALKQIGVTLKLQSTSDQVGAAREEQHKNLGFHLTGQWQPDYPDPINLPLQLVYGPHAKAGFYNEANYHNAKVDELIDRNLASIDPQERVDLAAQAMKIVAEDVPYVTLFVRAQSVALKKEFAYDNFIPSSDATFWVNQIRKV